MSLERKIIASFLISAGLVAALALAGGLTFVEIRREIIALELSDTLRSKTLLLRRHEKNYFLYGEAKERAEVYRQLDELYGTLRIEAPRARSAALGDLARNVREYRERFGRIERLAAQLRVRLAGAEAVDRHVRSFLPLVEAVLLERPLVNAEVLGPLLPPAARAAVVADLTALDGEISGLRRNGEETLLIAQDLDAAARAKVERALARSQTAALVLVPLSMLVGVGFLVAISHSVVRRLKLLTAVIERTGQGEFSADLLAEDEASDEVGVLVRAVNQMERGLAGRDLEIAAKNEELLQGRKLAAIGTLASGVAHELNNPLNNISLAAQILARSLPAGGGAPIVRETLDDILSQTQRVKRIVGDLLEFAREKGPELRRVDLVGIIREAAARAIPPGSAVDFRLAGEPEAAILADEHLVTQVFVNLIANAVDAIGGSGEVTVTVGRRGGMVQAAVADTGRGIPADELPKVFDPFFTTKEQGTGLGLAIVYNAVRKHGGSVDVRSEPERGTTFTVTLPGAS
jgi:two-component system, NtrC family, sensor kinase